VGLFSNPHQAREISVFTSKQDVAAPRNSATSVRPGECDHEGMGAARSLSKAGARRSTLSSCWPPICVTLPMSTQPPPGPSQSFAIFQPTSAQRLCRARMLGWLCPQRGCSGHGECLCSCLKHQG